MTSPTDGTAAPDESPAPYGSGHAATSGGTTPKRVRVHHLRAMKERGERFAMLTSYDQMTAEIFDAAGLPVLLVGDSAANNVLGYETTLPVTRRRADPVGARRQPRRPSCARRRRPAVRVVPGVGGAGARDLGALHEGGRRARREARGRRGRRAPGAGAGHRRHPGDGAHRLHPAERARARRLPRPGPRRPRPIGWSPTRSPWPRPGPSPWCSRWCRPRWPSG